MFLGFKGLYDTNLRTDDFTLFAEGLEKLRLGDSKEVEFNTLEEGIYLKGRLGNNWQCSMGRGGKAF